MSKAPTDRHALSRRTILKGSLIQSSLSPIAFTEPRAVGEHQFDAWLAERARLDALLDVTPASNEEARERIYDRYFQIERLIVKTRCLDLPAIKAKAGLILWLMEMEGSDALPAMRHIKTYIDRIA